MTDLLLFRSRDFQEGIQSFLDRHEARFSGSGPASGRARLSARASIRESRFDQAR